MIEGVLFAPYKCDNVQPFYTRLMILVGKQYPNTEKDGLFVITELKNITINRFDFVSCTDTCYLHYGYNYSNQPLLWVDKWVHFEINSHCTKFSSQGDKTNNGHLDDINV